MKYYTIKLKLECYWCRITVQLHIIFIHCRMWQLTSLVLLKPETSNLPSFNQLHNAKITFFKLLVQNIFQLKCINLAIISSKVNECLLLRVACFWLQMSTASHLHCGLLSHFQITTINLINFWYKELSSNRHLLTPGICNMCGNTQLRDHHSRGQHTTSNGWLYQHQRSMLHGVSCEKYSYWMIVSAPMIYATWCQLWEV